MIRNQIGETLKGTLLIYDALNMKFQTLEVKVKPEYGRHEIEFC
jgi:hypothetical protein